MIDPAPPPPLTDAFLDELVDGGLTPARLREAALRLDREPDGWKRCALAFLEAQCWRESFRSIEDEVRTLPGADLPVAPSASTTTASAPSRWRRVATAAAIAAIAFILGWRLHPDRGPLPGQAETSRLAVADPARGEDAARTGDGLDRVGGGSADIPAEAPPQPTPPPIATVGRLRVGTGAGAAAVPILGGPGLDARWVANQPPPITDHERALLEQSGYQVDRQRRIITATLRDGRRVAVPVDRFRVRYTGNAPL